MSGALGYLTWISVRNRWRSQIRRLRQPRYALALVIGLAYIWTFLLRPQPSSRGAAEVLLGADARALAELGVLLLVAGAWLFAGGKLALAFAPAEVDFLFPAPLTRRQLVIYKLLRAQLVVAFNVVLWVFILARGGSALPPLVRAVTMWVFFTTLYLHRVGAGLARASWLEHGRAGVRQQRITTAVFALVAGAIIWSAIAAAPRVAAAEGASTIATIAEATRTPPASIVLAPLRWLLAPAFTQSLGDWLLTIVPALGLLLFHALWVLRADVAFEEAAAEASRERVRRIEALRARRAAPTIGTARLRGVLPLAPVGSPAVAIVWKNVLAFVRTVQLGRLASAFVFGVVAALIGAEGAGTRAGPAHFIAVVALTTAILLIILGPRVVRNDLRLDVASLELVKSFPLRGHVIVTAEIAASTVVLLALQLVLGVVAYAAYLSDPFPLPLMRGAWEYVALAPVAVLCLDAIALTSQNAAAVLLPSWVQAGAIVGGGVEMLGQSLLTTLAMLLVVAIGIIPPSFGGGVALVMAESAGAGRTLALIAAAATVLLVLAAELWGVVLWLGRVLERTEPAATGGVL